MHGNKHIGNYVKIPLPSYKYIPKQGGYPDKSNELSHIPKLPEPNTEFSNKNWQNSINFLYAIDLFNHSYYWEVHEVLEKIWKQKGKKSPERIFIQGLIQLSVALLKKYQSNANGLKRLAEKAIPKLLSRQGIYLGIDINDLIMQFKAFVNDKNENPPFISLKFN